jgi:LysR family transcriptional regulator, regulator for bpeEF and oprC
MNLTSLQAFVKVVQLGSFTRAADALDTQKARLSRVVSQLEQELSVRLLERSTRSLSLTEAGREFFERAHSILASVDEARQAMQRIRGEPQGTLRLTCGVEFGLVAVGGWISDYLAAYPQVQVDADYSNRVVDIVHEGYDLAVRVGPLSDSSLAARRLGMLDYGLYACAEYLRRHGAPAGPEELDAHPQIVYAGAAQQGQWRLVCRDATHTVKLQPQHGGEDGDAARPGHRPAAAACCRGGGPNHAAATRAARVGCARGAGARGVCQRALPHPQGARVHRHCGGQLSRSRLMRAPAMRRLRSRALLCTRCHAKCSSDTGRRAAFGP